MPLTKHNFTKDLTFLKTTNQRSFYIGCLGDKNLGDEVVYSAIQSLFAEKITFNPNKRTGLFAHLYLKFVEPSSIFLGGGNLIKKGLKPYLGRIIRKMNSFPNCKFIVFGTGVGDSGLWKTFGIETDIKGWTNILELSDFIGVRGPLSKRFLENWGVKKEIKVIGDPAIWYVRSKIKEKANAKKIGINLGPSFNNIFGQNEDEVITFGSEVIKYLMKLNWQIMLFPMCPNDVGYLKKVSKKAGFENLPMHMDYLNLSSTLDALESQDIFIGEKLHSVILSNCALTPSIMVAYRTKCIDYMLSIDASNWVIRTDNLDIKLAIDKINSLYANNENHQRELFNVMHYYRNLLRNSAVDVLDRLNS